MKKTLIAVAALAATGAFAQVTVYGRLDAGYSSITSTTGGGTTDAKTSGFTSRDSVSDFVGITGSEDLGGGLKAVFKLEGNMTPANGSGWNGADRYGYVGLAGSFGEVRVGQTYTPYFLQIAASDLFGITTLSTVATGSKWLGTSLPNQIMYTSPSFSGFQVAASMEMLGTETTPGAGTDSKQSGSTVTVSYVNGPLSVGAGVANRKTQSGATLATTAEKGGTQINARYDFGKFAVNGVAIGYEDKMPNGRYYFSNSIGLTVPMGKVKFLAMVGNNSDGLNTGSNYVVGVDYSLSAKTALYLKTGSVDNNMTASGNKTTGTAAGLRIVF